MTDPYTVLATICFSIAVAFPVGVRAGRKDMDKTWKANLELAKRIQRSNHPSTYGSHRKV